MSAHVDAEAELSAFDEVVAERDAARAEVERLRAGVERLRAQGLDIDWVDRADFEWTGQVRPEHNQEAPKWFVHRLFSDNERLRESLRECLARIEARLTGTEDPPIVVRARAALAGRGPEVAHSSFCEATVGGKCDMPKLCNPTPEDIQRDHDRALAEWVRERIARHIRVSPRFEGQLTTPANNGLLGRVAQDIENLDLDALLKKES